MSNVIITDEQLNAWIDVAAAATQADRGWLFGSNTAPEMTPDEVRAAVVVAEEHAAAAGTRRALLEVSGGITLETVGSYADTGADVVSSGSLTNSSPVLDIGLDIEVHR